MGNRKYENLDFVSIRLIEENNRRIFEFQNKFLKYFDNSNLSKISNLTNIYEKNIFTNINKLDSLKVLNFYKKIELLEQTQTISKILSKSYYFKNIDHLLPKSIELSNFLIDFQKENNIILGILNNKEFIAEFINNNDQEIDTQTVPKDFDLNVFGDRINQEINTQQSNGNIDSNIILSKLSKEFLSFLLIIFTFYVTNLDIFSDYKEAMVFIFNNIECKGITISRINLRIGPSFDNEIIVAIPKGSALLVYEETSNGWVKVKVNINNIDFDGYVSQAYIKKLNQ